LVYTYTQWQPQCSTLLGVFIIMLEQQILDKIAKKNKALLDSLKVVNIRLDGDYVIIRRKDSISARLEDLVFKYDSAYQLWYKEKNESN